MLDAPAQGPSDQQQLEQRDIVTTGTIVMTVSDVGVAADKLTGLAKDSGGRIDSRTESATSMSGTSTSGDVEPSAQLTLRIPSAKLDDFLAGAKGVGLPTGFAGAMHQGWTALLAVLRGATLAFGFVPAMDPGDGDPGRRGVPFAPTATPLEQVGALRRVGEWL